MFAIKGVSFLVLLILGVSAEESINKEQSKVTQTSPNSKLSKLSEFYIGDLLRTDDKEPLETSSTNDRPISSTPENVPTERVDNFPDSSRQISNYNIHGGHDYSLEEPEISSSVGPLKREGWAPVNVVEKYSIRHAERNVMSSEGDLPSGRYPRAREYPRHKPACKKHHHASSEEEYSADERSPQASPSRDYRSTPSSYYHPEGEHYISSHGSSQPSRSKSHDTSSQSKSGKSYSSSKSSSKSLNRPNKVHVFENGKPSYQSDYQQGHGSGGGIVVHKVRDTSDSEEDSYSSEAPHRRPNTHSPLEPVTQYYEDYPPQTQNYKRPKAPSHAEHSQGQEYNHGPSPYRKSRYETSGDSPIKQNRYNSPPAFNSQGYAQQSHDREPPTSHYRESAHSSKPQVNIRPQFQQVSHLQSSRQRKVRPQSSHTTHPSETGYNSPVQENSRQIIRPSEATTQEYNYNQTPHSNGGGNSNYQSRWKHSPRAERSPSQPGIQGRAENPLISITKSSPSPSVSRSVSYSESSYNMEPPTRTPMKALLKQQQSRTYGEPLKMTNPLHLNSEQGRGYQTAYKPYNSEYPASYAVGQKDFGPQSYESPHQAHDGSHSSYDRPQYNGPEKSYDGPEQSYDGPDKPYNGPHQSYDDSREQDGGYAHHEAPKPESDVTGYKDNYPDSKPLEIDDAFFEKYGISKSAKVIVATAEQPNLFVADGTHLKEGGSNDGYAQEYRSSKRNIEQDGRNKPFSPMSSVPGSFTELVESNPKFLRQQFAATSKTSTAEEFPDHDPSLDDLIFQSGFGNPKSFVKAQGTREIVQKHGDGVSRIIFNHPTDLGKSEASEDDEEYESSSESRGVEVLQKPDEDFNAAKKTVPS